MYFFCTVSRVFSIFASFLSKGVRKLLIVFNSLLISMWLVFGHTGTDWLEGPIQKNAAVLNGRRISLRRGRKSKFISTHLQIHILLKFYYTRDGKVSLLALMVAQFFLWFCEYHTPTNSWPKISLLRVRKSTASSLHVQFSYVAQFHVGILGNPLHQQNLHPQQPWNTIFFLFHGSKSHYIKIPWSRKKKKLAIHMLVNWT